MCTKTVCRRKNERQEGGWRNNQPGAVPPALVSSRPVALGGGGLSAAQLKVGTEVMRDLSHNARGSRSNPSSHHRRPWCIKDPGKTSDTSGAKTSLSFMPFQRDKPGSALPRR